MSPLPGYGVFPDGWAAAHRPTAEAAMVSRVDLSRPATPGGWDPVNGPAEAFPVAPYAPGTPARLQALANRSDGGESAGQDVTVGTYRVSVPMAVPPVQVRDRVTVTAADDPHLVGRSLTVADVTYGSTPWQRDLVCTLDQSDHPDDT